MKKFIKLSGTLLIAFILLSGLSSCVRSEHEYPVSIKKNFMKGCLSSPATNEKICDCMFDKIQKKYTYKEFLKIDKQITKGHTPKDYMDFIEKAAMECVKNKKKNGNSNK